MRLKIRSLFPLLFSLLSVFCLVLPNRRGRNVSFRFVVSSAPEARETVSLQTTIQKESYFLDEDWGLDFVSVADVVGSWERVHTMHTMEELEFFTGSTCTDDMGTSTFEDNESIPSSIQSSASLLSPFEAREKVRKLALQANNVDDFFELM
ncbi:unnamed protein product [Meloidogyne enterolobii]|uniref:Uncharacterized protein n=1 Tax=Meloidogyne enterolobii TaxID=390850 RepID=A0ACB0ZYP6_MELEN